MNGPVSLCAANPHAIRQSSCMLRGSFIRVVTAPESNRETRLHAPASITTLINPRLSGVSCLSSRLARRRRILNPLCHQIQGPLFHGVCGVRKADPSFPVCRPLGALKRWVCCSLCPHSHKVHHVAVIASKMGSTGIVVLSAYVPIARTAGDFNDDVPASMRETVELGGNPIKAHMCITCGKDCPCA